MLPNRVSARANKGQGPQRFTPGLPQPKKMPSPAELSSDEENLNNTITPRSQPNAENQGSLTASASGPPVTMSGTEIQKLLQSVLDSSNRVQDLQRQVEQQKKLNDDLQSQNATIIRDMEEMRSLTARTLAATNQIEAINQGQSLPVTTTSTTSFTTSATTSNIYSSAGSSDFAGFGSPPNSTGSGNINFTTAASSFMSTAPSSSLTGHIPLNADFQSGAVYLPPISAASLASITASSSSAPVVPSLPFTPASAGNPAALSTVSQNPTALPGCDAYIVQRNSAGQEYYQRIRIVSNQSSSVPNVATPLLSGPATPHPVSMNYPQGQVLLENRNPDFKRHLELPSFCGRPESWPLFQGTFNTTTEMYGYSNLENLLRLQKSLTGEARKAVESMLIHPQHVPQVMQTLETAFGRPEQLVRSQINLARSLPNVDDSHLELLIEHSTVVQNLATYLNTETTQHHLANPTLLDELLLKLPISRRLDWAAVASTIHPYPTLLDYSEWIGRLARLFSLIAPSTSSTKTTTSSSTRSNNLKPAPTSNKPIYLLADINKAKTEAVCYFCRENHDVRRCKSLLNLQVPERLKEIANVPLCYGCLCSDHLLPACTTKRRCGTDGCQMWHDPMLHMVPINKRTSQPRQTSASDEKKVAPKDEQPEPSTSISSPSEILHCRESRPEGHLLFRVVPVVLHGPRQDIRTYALLDEGSSVSLIDSDLADELQLEGISSTLKVQWFDKQSAVASSRSVSLDVSGEAPDARRYTISNLRTIKDLMLPTQSVDRAAILQRNPHLQDVPFGSYVGALPKILLGLDNHHLGLPRQFRTSPEEDGIVAANTKLGWVVYGSDEIGTLPGASLLHISEIADQSQHLAYLHELVKEHFTTESFGVKIQASKQESDDVIRARMLLNTSTKRISNRFETGLLWKHDIVDLPDSFGMALRRLSNIEAKMRKNPCFGQDYCNQIDQYISKGYARKLSTAEAASRTSRTWFLPHFAIQNINKPGKFRLVFDAAASVNGVSLNSMLLTGPDVNVPLTRLLFQLRIGAVGICGDIREMYHQVLVRREDQDAQRFLWRKGDSTKLPDVYVMQVMTFGSTCSPASAQYVKNLNADEFKEEFPEASDAIKRCHYVDDYVASFATPEEAQRITLEVIELHRRGGFELRGIVSNDETIRTKFGSGPLDSGSSISLEPDTTTEKILGMNWDTAEDSFRFMTRFNRVHKGVVEGTKLPTKREILSTTMSIFDPFGLLANFTLASKVILQDLWRLGIGWDEPVPVSIKDRWETWRSQIEKTRQVRVPRCYSLHIRSAQDLQLHVFADASEIAFAAVAFWRIQFADKVELSFIAGKARCAPVQLLSIPRLELQAAVLATRLLVEICESHPDLLINKTVLWSDSETVLKWIRSTQRRYKPFVAFRVAEVVESAPASTWRWVPTSMNVADDATRVNQPFHFEPNSRWTRGPDWLLENAENWPVQKIVATAEKIDEEERSKFVGVLSKRGPVPYDNFSRFYRLCRSIAWAVRFTTNARCRIRDKRFAGELTTAEVTHAENIVCRWVQQEAFAPEIAALQSKGSIATTSQVFKLKPYLDDEDLMRVHGRADAADEEYLSSDSKRPILLPDDHRFTYLLVRHHHERMAHQLVDATIAAVRQRYWVPRLRKLVRQVQHDCRRCRLRNAKPTIPIQGQLPRDRMDAYARPFTNTGLDYFGPVMVTIGRRREKRWVALFTCLTVRAVHLEIAEDLSTDACLVCIRNLCNVRGVPSLIRCDNGTNFIGARNELERESNFFDPTAIQRDLSTRGVEWRFNCPANPEAGGAWERLVQSVKRVLRVTLKEEAPRVETLRSLLLEAANMINSRPLTHIQVDPFDMKPITPNHFLLGGPNVATVPNPADVEPRATRKQWQICRRLSRIFWRQWVRDYLPELTRRNKHYPEQPPLKIGDLVVVCDGNLPRSKWMRGRIEGVTIGKDCIIRTATVRTKDGAMRRPITKLAILDEGPSPMQSTDGGRDVAI